MSAETTPRRSARLQKHGGPATSTPLRRSYQLENETPTTGVDGSHKRKRNDGLKEQLDALDQYGER